MKEEYAYIYHLSDLHLGLKKNDDKKNTLYKILETRMKENESSVKPYFLITGDLMSSPTNSNLVKANSFLFHLKYQYNAHVSFVLGNHDVEHLGIGFGRNMKSKVLSFLLDEKVRVLEELKIILIRLDSNTAGQFARGMVGRQQLDQVDYLLNKITNKDIYTIIVMMHHHLLPVKKPADYQKKFSEKYFSKVIEPTKILIDKELVLSWLKRNNIKYVLHGHKHIPMIQELAGINIIGCGSSTGSLKRHDDYVQYMSIIEIKYNMGTKEIDQCNILNFDNHNISNFKNEIKVFNL